MINKYILTAFLIIFCAQPALSEVSCHDDYYGNTVCEDGMGNTMTNTQSPLGNDVYTTNNGQRFIKRQTLSGDDVYEDGYGNSIACRQTLSGEVVCENQ